MIFRAKEKLVRIDNLAEIVFIATLKGMVMQTTRLSYSSRLCCLAPKATSLSSKFLCLLILTFSFTRAAFALDLPDYELSYEKSSGKVIGIINKTANRELNPLVIKSPATRKFDPKEVESLNIQSSDKFLLEKGKLLGIKNVASELFPKVVKEDKLGTKVLRYEQRLQGVPVYGGEIVTQLNSNYEVLSTSGRMISDLKIDTSSKLSAAKAIKIAKKDMERRYGWRSALSVAKRDARKSCRNSDENSICVGKHIRKFNKSNGFYSNKKPELVIYNSEFMQGSDATSGSLAWRLYITNLKEDSEEFFVDAANGLIISAHETKQHDTYIRVSDCSNFLGDGLCYSQKSAPAYPGYIFGRKGDAPPRGPNPVLGPLFGSTDVDETYDLIPEIHNYYFTKFGRNGGNNLGGIGDVFCPTPGTCVPGSGPHYVGETNIRVNSNGTSPDRCNPHAASFQWNPPALNFCRDSNTLDILGHEYAHTVAWFDSFNPDGSFNSVITGGGLSGTLNESTADVMGEAFEKYITGIVDWKTGGELGEHVFRDLADPPSLFYDAGLTYPDRYNHPHFYCGSGNNGGVHVNSTVPSKAAYLASEGGTFNGCTIQGMGLNKIEQIWYRALTVYYTASTTFNQAYFALNQACNDFAVANTHGITTSNCENLKAALQAVELDQGGFCSGIPPVTPECALPTSTPTPTATATQTATQTATNTPTVTSTATSTAKNTATATASNTPTSTSTATHTATATATSTLTPSLTPTNTATATNTATQTATNTSTAQVDPVITNTPEPTATNTPIVEATVVSVPTVATPVVCTSTAGKPDVKVKGKNATLKISAKKLTSYKFIAKPIGLPARKAVSKSVVSLKNGKLSYTFKNLKEGLWDFSYSIKVKKIVTESCPVQAKL